MCVFGRHTGRRWVFILDSYGKDWGTMNIYYPPLPVDEQIKKPRPLPAWWDVENPFARRVRITENVGRPKKGRGPPVRVLVIGVLEQTPWKTSNELIDILDRAKKSVNDVLLRGRLKEEFVRRKRGREYEYALAGESREI